MIQVKPSPTADTRTCDVTKVSKQQLLESSRQHIADVGKGLGFFAAMLTEAASKHDYDKLTNIEQFYADFQTKFEQTIWWDNHRRIHRHHLGQEDGIPEDVNLIDLLEYVSDCVLAGKARSGEVYELSFTDDLLRNAFNNTVKLLDANVEVVSDDQSSQSIES